MPDGQLDLPHLINAQSLTKNVILNIFGQGLPLFAGVVSIPFLIRGLGIERFGVLTLAWIVMSYFSLFDLGLGQALTKMVAEKLGGGKTRDIALLVWTALIVIGLLGVLGTIVTAALSPWLVFRVLKIPDGLKAESLNVFYFLAFAILLVISSAGLRGVLEAFQRFDLVNALRIPLGIFMYVGPLLVLPYSRSVLPVVGLLVCGRLVVWGLQLLLCCRLVPSLREGIRFEGEMLPPLLRFGGWVTVSGIVGPMMMYFDRFLIGSLISMAAVAYYVTPYEVVTKLELVPMALFSVLFPAFSATLVKDRARTARLFGRGINYTFMALFPLTLILVTFAHEGLAVWLGLEFARNSERILQWLAVGVFINSLTLLPSGLILGAGRPDLVAKAHLIELPCYAVTLWLLLSAYGITGAAISWVLRVSANMIILFIMASRLLPSVRPFLRRRILPFLMALAALVVAGYAEQIQLKAMFLIGVVLLYLPLSWFLLLAAEDRQLIKRLFSF